MLPRCHRALPSLLNTARFAGPRVHALNPGSATAPWSTRWLRRQGCWHGFRGEIFPCSATDEAWRLLSSYLERYSSQNSLYHRCVINKLLAHGIPLPNWLINSYKVRRGRGSLLSTTACRPKNPSCPRDHLCFARHLLVASFTPPSHSRCGNQCRMLCACYRGSEQVPLGIVMAPGACSLADVSLCACRKWMLPSCCVSI